MEMINNTLNQEALGNFEIITTCQTAGYTDLGEAGGRRARAVAPRPLLSAYARLASLQGPRIDSLLNKYQIQVTLKLAKIYFNSFKHKNVIRNNSLHKNNLNTNWSYQPY